MSAPAFGRRGDPPDEGPGIAAEHREILEAIKHGDAKAARSAMHRHMRNVRTRFSSSWSES